MGEKRDLIGQKFNYLTPIERYERYKNGKTYYLCRCDCGKLTIVEKGALVSGRTKSCGCYHKKRTSEMNTKHSHSTEKLYYVWKAIKKRCYCKTDMHYKYYGSKGITVCDEWKSDYMAFRNWAFENGYKEMTTYTNYTIDRINPFGNYEPSNCRIADWKTQARNRRANYATI